MKHTPEAADRRLQAQHERDAKKLRAGDKKASELNERLQQRVADAEARAAKIRAAKERERGIREQQRQEKSAARLQARMDKVVVARGGKAGR